MKQHEKETDWEKGEKETQDKIEKRVELKLSEFTNEKKNVIGNATSCWTGNVYGRALNSME